MRNARIPSHISISARRELHLYPRPTLCLRNKLLHVFIDRCLPLLLSDRSPCRTPFPFRESRALSGLITLWFLFQISPNEPSTIGIIVIGTKQTVASLQMHNNFSNPRERSAAKRTREELSLIMVLMGFLMGL